MFKFMFTLALVILQLVIFHMRSRLKDNFWLAQTVENILNYKPPDDWEGPLPGCFDGSIEETDDRCKPFFVAFSKILQKDDIKDWLTNYFFLEAMPFFR